MNEIFNYITHIYEKCNFEVKTTISLLLEERKKLSQTPACAWPIVDISFSFRVGRNIRGLKSAEIALGRAPFHESHGNEGEREKKNEKERENAIGEVEKAIRAYV